jgi:hypothetical protein
MEWLIGAAALTAIFLGFRILRARKGVGRKVTVANPSIGFHNLGGPEFAHYLEEDQAALTSLFRKAIPVQGDFIPRCDVLFLYASVGEDGSVRGTATSTLRQLAADAGASILVLASNNTGRHVTAAAKRDGPRQASLVLTLDRKGEDFTKFFHELFAQMLSGKAMPMAWVAIAPQHQSVMPANVPSTIFIPDGGVVSFQVAQQSAKFAVSRAVMLRA